MACKNNKINRFNFNIYKFIDCILVDKLKKIIDRKRFLHSLSVAEISFLLAKKFKVNLKNAIIAGLLHDCAKSIHINMAKKYLNKLKVDDLIKKNPAIWHAYIGSIYAKEIFGIKNKEILSAIKYHTVGFEKMSKLAKIIYFADFFAHDRKFVNFITLNKLLRKKDISLEKLVLFVLKNKLVYLINNSKKIHLDSIKLYNKIV